uniref:Uncharacterized protein n=1 Tax=Nelumbo nucifera TaxID=4432 RepID=A0A822ZM36_NELNU|nr:TPA_asm: hypothetical protein HUJ06_002266 [Nelumbo nucifera]
MMNSFFWTQNKNKNNKKKEKACGKREKGNKRGRGIWLRERKSPASLPF